MKLTVVDDSLAESYGFFALCVNEGPNPVWGLTMETMAQGVIGISIRRKGHGRPVISLGIELSSSDSIMSLYSVFHSYLATFPVEASVDEVVREFPLTPPKNCADPQRYMEENVRGRERLIGDLSAIIMKKVSNENFDISNMKMNMYPGWLFSNFLKVREVARNGS